MIYETNPNYGAIEIKGSDDPTKKDYSTISVGSDVTLEGWSGIFINHNNNTGYGILVNMNGKINAIDDVNGGSGVGIYVNGNIQHEDNAPIINLSETVSISSSGNGIYAAGYAIYNINGSYISGKESGLGIKSGVFNIKNGTIKGSGEDKTPTSGNNNGINASGSAIQIESNSKYKGNIEINIEKGLIESKNSNVIYEYTVNNVPTQVKSISISGGTYKSDANKDVFSLSDSFKNTHQEFISGGSFSSNPTPYLKTGYGVSKDTNTLYEVISSTMSVFNQQQNNSNNLFIWFLLIIIGFILYFNRIKITNFIKKQGF